MIMEGLGGTDHELPKLQLHQDTDNSCPLLWNIVKLEVTTNLKKLSDEKNDSNIMADLWVWIHPGLKIFLTSISVRWVRRAPL